MPFPIEKAPTKKITTLDAGVKISKLLNYPVRGLVFEGGNTIQDLSNTVSNACICLQDNNVPYNVLIADCGRRIFLFPQVICFEIYIFYMILFYKIYTIGALLTLLIIISCPNFFVPSDEQCYAEKQALGEVNAELLDTQVNPAVWEISGHMVLKRKKDYEEASEENAWRLLAEVSLSEERFQEVNALIFEAIASVDNGNGNATLRSLEEPDAKPKSHEEVDAIHPTMVAGTSECLVLQ